MGLVNITEEKTKEWAEELVKRGELSKNDAECFVKSVIDKAESGTKNIEEKVKGLIEKTLENANIPLKDDIARLEKKIKDLEKKIKDIEKNG